MEEFEEEGDVFVVGAGFFEVRVKKAFEGFLVDGADELGGQLWRRPYRWFVPAIAAGRSSRSVGSLGRQGSS